MRTAAGSLLLDDELASIANARDSHRHLVVQVELAQGNGADLGYLGIGDLVTEPLETELRVVVGPS